MGADWFDRIYLEAEQVELLSWMVEGERALPSHQHDKFLLVGTMEGYFLIHPHLGERPAVRQGDLETLADNGLLRRGFGGKGTPNYELTPQGRRYYAEMKQRAGASSTIVEEEIHRYLDSEAFTAVFPDAYARWLQAEQNLWGAEDEGAFTEIGHICRESMQSFSLRLVERAGISDMPPDPAKTVDRVRATLRGASLGSTHLAMLDALLVYWGTVSDIVQRQEHGAGKAGDPLTWEDARRVVFQTAIVMFEISRALDQR
jgi:hypothetical protein